VSEADEVIGSQAVILILQVELARTKELCGRAAAALAYETLGRNSQIEIRDWFDLIAELRKAAE